MKIRVYFLSFLLSFAVIFGFARAAAYAQEDAVIIEGNPPLKASMVAKTLVLFEWSLDIKLSEEQKTRIAQVLVGYWKANDKEEINGTIEIVNLVDRLMKATAEERGKAKDAVRAEVLQGLHNQPNDEVSRIVLEAYEAAHYANPSSSAQSNNIPAARRNKLRVGADGFAGIYRLVRPKMVGVGVVTEYITFLPDGHVFWSLPPAGLLYFDSAEAAKNRPNDWGTYEIKNGEVHIFRGAEKKHYVMTGDGENLNNPTSLGKGVFRRLPPSDGLRLEGAYRQNETGPSVTFAADGTFRDAGAFRYSGYTRLDGTGYQDDGVGGSGTYRIEQNTLELSYSDGRVKRFAFLAYSHNLAKNPAVDYFSINRDEIMKRY